MTDGAGDQTPPYQSYPHAQIYIQAFLKEGAHKSPKLRKTVKFDKNRPKQLSAVIEEIFYKDAARNDIKCLAIAEKKSQNCEEFESVLSHYGTTLCEDGAKYKIVFYDAATVSTKFLSKFFLELSPAPLEDEKESKKTDLGSGKGNSKQTGNAFIEAVFKDGTKESGLYVKAITVDSSDLRPLMGYVMVIFYQDTTWCKHDCNVVIEKFEDGRFNNVATRYDRIKVEDGDKFKIHFLKFSSLTKTTKETMCERAILLEKESDAQSVASTSLNSTASSGLDSTASSSPDDAEETKVLVEAVVKSNLQSGRDFQIVLNIDEKPLSLLKMIVDAYKTHVQSMQPTMQFIVTASRYNEVFRRHLYVNEDYAKVSVVGKDSYFIEFVNASLVQHKKQFSVVIPEKVEAVPTSAAPIEAVPTSHKALIEAFYKNASSEFPKFVKSVSFEADSPVKLITSVMDVFYNDTQWGKKKCYASVTVRAGGFDDFVNVLSDYEETSLEDKRKYRVVFYDAKDFSQDELPKYCVSLDGTEQEQEVDSDEEIEDDPSDEEEEPEVNVVKFSGVVQRQIEEPKMKVLLEVACPKKCSTLKRQWICSECSQSVFYAFSDHLHCNCGAHLKSDATFKCGSEDHGTVYKTLALSVYSSIEKCEEINIVLMGETGAGKSTWIDAIFNYILHSSLDEAVEGGTLEIPIPTHFLLEDDDKKLRKIFVGEQTDNEDQTIGASATQSPKSYTFMRNGKFYRLIDVPGVGDSRGVEQDRKNFEMILQELYNYDRIHAVCILIPADSPRLTIAMKYCINELLTHLHQDAAKNLVFCFTKARVNFYKAGNTQEILENYVKSFQEKRNVQISLNKNTMYYFDNESFKFLCALRNGMNLLDNKQDFVKSWDISATNSYRVLDYIASLQPHMTRDMLSLNEAKRIILELTPISAEITKNIQTNKRIIEAKKVELNEMKKQTVSLKEQLMIKQTTLVAVPIDYPKTVCASASCVDTLGIPGTSESQVLYRTICHSKCAQPNIEPGTYPNPRLQKCWAMLEGPCRVCGCSWDTHLHIRYEQRQETVDVPNKEVEKVIAGKNVDEVRVCDVIKGLETRLGELNLKERRMKTICAKFVAFLNKNAIAVINDAYGEYLEQSIKLAKNEVAVSGEGSEKVDQLEKYLAEYKEEVAIINDHIASGFEDITINNIEAMKEELKAMDELGDQFKSFLNAIDHSEKNYVREDEVHLFKSSAGLISSVASMVKDGIKWATGRGQEEKLKKEKRVQRRKVK